MAADDVEVAGIDAALKPPQAGVWTSTQRAPAWERMGSRVRCSVSREGALGVLALSGAGLWIRPMSCRWNVRPSG